MFRDAFRLVSSQASSALPAGLLVGVAACGLALPHLPEEQGELTILSWVAPAALGEVAGLTSALPVVPGRGVSPKGEATAPGNATPGPAEAVIPRLKRWLTERGADISRLDFKPSQVGSEAGVGVFLADGQRPLRSPGRRWWLPFFPPPPHTAVAEFPLSLAITAANILSEPQVGQDYSWLLERRAIDERQLVQCYLAVERARGAASPLAPWLEALPREWHTPLCWSPEELAELRGTTLDRATRELRTRLADTWLMLAPTLQQVSRQLGAPVLPSFDDYVWAHCVFWSRGQSLPVPHTPGAASALLSQASRQAGSGPPPLAVHEAIIPGLDFVNHASGGRAGCWWEVWRGSPAALPPRYRPPAPSEATGLASSTVRLHLHRGWTARPGDELTISYGDGRPNEELLLLYGFVAAGAGPGADTVMVACPVPPPAERDELTNARMELLRSCGMRPQFFLQGGKGAEDAAPPPEVLETLEVFALNKQEVAARQAALLQHRLPGPPTSQQAGSDEGLPEALLSGAELDLTRVRDVLRQRGGPSAAQLSALATQLGLRMATLSIYIRLLEAKVVDMEDDEHGTGSLEQDLAMLAAHDVATSAGIGAEAGGALPYRRWCALVYRAGQKRMVRAHVTGARKELQRVLGLLEEVQARQHAGLREPHARAANSGSR